MLYLDYSRPAGEWTPNVYGGRENLEAVQFLQEMNATVHKIAPGIVTIAEESTSWPGVTRPTNLGGLGFSMKWNMGWMNDTLDFISHDPVHRSYHHHEMTFSMLYAFSENYVLPISHDEVVHGKGTLWGRMPGNDHVKAAGLRSLLAYQWAHRVSSCCSWVRSSASARNGPRSAVWTGISSARTASPTESSGWCRTSTASTAACRAVVARHQPRGILLDRRQRLGQQRAELPAVRRRRLDDGVRVQLLRFRAHPLPAGVATCGQPGARCSTPTRRSTTAPGWATTARWKPPTSRATGGLLRR